VDIGRRRQAGCDGGRRIPDQHRALGQQPANGGANFKRAVRADSAEYQALAAANTANNPGQPMSRYVGRTDINYLANVASKPVSATVGAYTPDLTGLTGEQIGNVMTAPALTSNVFQETIMGVRRGLNLVADYRHDNTLRFFSEFNYTYYLYHQNYRGLNSPFSFNEGLANRNVNGGSNDLLASKRVLGGTFLNSTVNTVGGDEHTPYTTWIGAGGVDWNPTPEPALKGEFNYIKSKKTQDNRSVNMDSKAGLYWDTTRVADGEPHQLTFSGPNLGAASNFVFRDYANGTNQIWDDKGHATALSGKYTVGEGLLRSIKFGSRFAHQESQFNSYNFAGRALTVDGLPLNAARSNGISADTLNVTQPSPTNFMNGDAGYAGGYVVYAPGALLGNQVSTLFPKAGILPEDGYRLVYTWRSDSILFGASANPIDARGIEATGILDGSINYNIDENFTLSFNASNILDKALNRFVGEPGAYQTGIARQHYANGRTFSLAMRYKFGK
jgi:iron complex outermembrane receptor protein